MLMPGRSMASYGYRFGFNGKEKDDEIDGVTGSKLDFGARIYDSRIGRWLSLDPLFSKYPDLSPYVFVGNCPLLFIDPDGKKIVNYRKMVLSNKTLIKKLKAFDLAVARLAERDVNSYKFVISGGDRYKKDGKIYSATNNKVISNSSDQSQHLKEEGATAVDLKFAEGISYDILVQAAKEVGLRVDPDGKYDDGHFHLDLKNSNEKMQYNAKDYIPPNSDFGHAEKKVAAVEKIEKFQNKIGPKLDKINSKLEKIKERQKARIKRREERAKKLASK